MELKYYKVFTTSKVQYEWSLATSSIEDHPNTALQIIIGSQQKAETTVSINNVLVSFLFCCARIPEKFCRVCWRMSTYEAQVIAKEKKKVTDTTIMEEDLER